VSSAAAFSRVRSVAGARSRQPGVNDDAKGTVKINHARDLDHETNCRSVTAFQGEDDLCRLSGVLCGGTARREFFTRQAGVSAFGVSDDTAAIANSILVHEASFRLGFALNLISLASYVAVTALFCQLFAPVSRSLSLVAVFFSMVGLAVQACGSLLQLAPLVILGGSPYLSVFSVAQLQALALMFLNLNAQVGSISLVFDGLFLLLIGYLIFRSTFMPRILGVLLACAGLGWLSFLSPPLANQLLPFLEVLGVVAEAALMLWLLLIGVNDQRWSEQASAMWLSNLATLQRQPKFVRSGLDMFEAPNQLSSRASALNG
jgi:hypothetical protein